MPRGGGGGLAYVPRGGGLAYVPRVGGLAYEPRGGGLSTHEVGENPKLNMDT